MGAGGFARAPADAVSSSDHPGTEPGSMTRRARVLALLPLLALPGCAGPGKVAPGGALAYGTPRLETLDYVAGDSARIQIEAGGQRFAVSADVREAWRMVFAPAAQGARVTATLTGMQATLTTPM